MAAMHPVKFHKTTLSTAMARLRAWWAWLGTEWAVAAGLAGAWLLLVTCLDFGLADLGGGGAFGSTGSRFPRQNTFR